MVRRRALHGRPTKAGWSGIEPCMGDLPRLDGRLSSLAWATYQGWMVGHRALHGRPTKVGWSLGPVHRRGRDALRAQDDARDAAALAVRGHVRGREVVGWAVLARLAR